MLFFKDILIESGVIGQGSVKGAMSGKFCNACIRSHNIVHEAWKRLRFQAFLQTLPDDNHKEMENQIAKMRNHYPNQQFIKH